MRSVLSIILIYSLAITSVFAQSVNPNDTLKIGNKSSSSDKGITFDTNDGVNNKKLLVEKISKKLKWDGNSVQIGDGSSSSDKELVIAGALKSLKYNGTTGEFEFNDDLKLSGELKSDILRAINTEVSVKSLLRAEQGIKVGTGSNEIRVNAGNLEFSNDGVLYKKFGTGTGNGGSSGISILENASFEDGITTGWTSSGGTFSQETYTNSVEGSTKYARFVATAAAQYFETTLKEIPDNFSGGCQADFKKVNVSTDDLFKVEVLTSTATVLTFGNVKKSAWVKFPTINFPCPTAGSTVKLRVTSLAAGTIEVDDAYLGSNQNLVNTIVSYDYDWTSYTPTFTGFGAAVVSGAGCFHKRKGGDLHLACQFTAGTQTATEARVSLPNSLITLNNFTGVQKIGDWTANYSEAYSGHLLIDPNVGYVTFAKQGSGSSGLGKLAGNSLGAASSTYAIRAIVPISGWTEIKQQDIAVNTDQASWFIDANIGGANANLGTSNLSSYTEVADGGLDLVVNTAKGSAAAEIPCSAGTNSTGATCSGVFEHVGVAFVPPSAGLYEACFAFGHLVNTAANGAAYVTFQLAETPNNSLTILQEGGDRVESGLLSSVGIDARYPRRVCGTFSFSDSSKKTIRLMREQSFSGTVSANNIVANRLATAGQYDIHVTVRPLLSAYNRPILTGDQVTTPGANKPETFSVSYGTTSASTSCSASPCSYLDQIGNSVTSVTRSGTGQYAINTSKTYSKLKCSWVGSGSVGIVIGSNIQCSNCNSLAFDTVRRTDGASDDSRGTLLCHGIPQ